MSIALLLNLLLIDITSLTVVIYHTTWQYSCCWCCKWHAVLLSDLRNLHMTNNTLLTTVFCIVCISIIYSTWSLKLNCEWFKCFFSCSLKNVIMKLAPPGWTSTFGSWPSPLNASSRGSRCPLTENSDGSSGRLPSSSSSSRARGHWGLRPSPWLTRASPHSRWMRRLLNWRKLLTRWPVDPAKWCFSGA